jgi:hypothetical protein
LQCRMFVEKVLARLAFSRLRYCEFHFPLPVLARLAAGGFILLY